LLLFFAKLKAGSKVLLQPATLLPKETSTMETLEEDLKTTTPLQEAAENGNSDGRGEPKQRNQRIKKKTRNKPSTKPSHQQPKTSTLHENLPGSKSKAKSTQQQPETMTLDENLPTIPKDPRGDGERIKQKNKKKGGRNTESFDPASTLVRPSLRVQIGSASISRFNKVLKHDDVVIVPELFGPEDDWKLYYQLVQEITELQEKQVAGSEWISWHEGAHLIVKKPDKSPTFNTIVDCLCEYFGIQRKSVGTRFNWYKDSSDWKPFHHDSAYVYACYVVVY